MPDTRFNFTLEATDGRLAGRAGCLSTPHGEVRTPAFMPVGTAATVKGLLPEQLRAVGVEMVLANAYHLALRPGAELVEELGGLHEFMQWDGPILTDSGGFQVFSLAHRARIDDRQVTFQSHIDGDTIELSPERAIEIQEQLGADIIMCLDECPPHDVPRERLAEAVERTTRWAGRCREAHRREDQALFGIVQGGIDPELRERSVAGLLPLEFAGYAVGGLSVGEGPAAMYRALDVTVPMLPADRPRYLMGVGTPSDLVEAVARGIDLFDCVMPTRNGRNGMAFTSEGSVRIRNSRYRDDPKPLDARCACPVCCRFSRGYLRHLVIAGEVLGLVLLSWHNLAIFQQLMVELRQAIVEQRLDDYRTVHLARMAASV